MRIEVTQRHIDDSGIMPRMSNLHVVQFAYREGPPPPGIPVVDCRVIPNPWNKGKDPRARQRVVRADPRFEGLVREACDLLTRHSFVAVGCAYGRDRSSAVAEEVATRTQARILTRTEFARK